MRPNAELRRFCLRNSGRFAPVYAAAGRLRQALEPFKKLIDYGGIGG